MPAENHLNILVVSEYWKPKEMGGGEVSAELLMQGLAEQGHKVTVLTSHFQGLPLEEKKKGLHIIRALTTGEKPSSLASTASRYLFFNRSLKKELNALLNKHSFDVIHAFGPSTLPTIAQVKTNGIKAAHISSVVAFCPKGTLLQGTPRGEVSCPLLKCDIVSCTKCIFYSREIGKIQATPFLRYNPLVPALLFKRYRRYSYENTLHAFDIFFPISTYLAGRTQSVDVPAERIHVLHNPMQKEAFHYRRSKNKVPKLYFIGNYLESKGHLVLLEALSLVKGNFEMHFYGKGPLENLMRAKMQQLGIKGAVHGWVPQEELAGIHVANDICVLPSLVLEGLGRTLIEAMSVGNPTIGTTAGGIPDIIENSQTGFLVPPGDVESMAQCIQKLVDSRDLRERMGLAGYTRAQELFSLDSRVKSLVAGYEKAMAAHRKSL